MKHGVVLAGPRVEVRAVDYQEGDLGEQTEPELLIQAAALWDVYESGSCPPRDGGTCLDAGSACATSSDCCNQAPCVPIGDAGLTCYNDLRIKRRGVHHRRGLLQGHTVLLRGRVHDRDVSGARDDVRARRPGLHDCERLLQRRSVRERPLQLVNRGERYALLDDMLGEPFPRP